MLTAKVNTVGTEKSIFIVSMSVHCTIDTEVKVDSLPLQVMLNKDTPLIGQ